MEVLNQVEVLKQNEIIVCAIVKTLEHTATGHYLCQKFKNVQEVFK